MVLDVEIVGIITSCPVSCVCVCVCVDRIRGRTRDLAYRSGLTGSKEKKETERESEDTISFFLSLFFPSFSIENRSIVF